MVTPQFPALDSWTHESWLWEKQHQGALLAAQTVKIPPAMQESQVWSLGWEDPLEKMGTHSCILTWEIPWTEEPGGLQSMGSQRVGHDWGTNTHILPQNVAQTLQVLPPNLCCISDPVQKIVLQATCFRTMGNMVRPVNSMSMVLLPHFIWCEMSSLIRSNAYYNADTRIVGEAFCKTTDGNFGRSIASRKGKFVSRVSIPVEAKHCPFCDGSSSV